MAKRVRKRHTIAHEEDHQQRRRHQDNAAVRAQFLVVSQCEAAAADGSILEGKIGTRDEHEHDDDPIERGAIVASERQRVRRKAAGGHGGHRMTDGVEQRHARQRERRDLRDRERRVQSPQRDRRLTELGGQLLVRGPRGFGEEEFAPADRQSWKHCDERARSHPAHQASASGPPEEHAAPDGRKVGDHRGAGRGQTDIDSNSALT